MADDNTEDEEAARKRKRGTRGGIAMIVFGVLSAFVVYYQDSNSFEISRMMLAKDYAILHAVLWGIAGLVLILWANRPPQDKTNNTYDPNDPYR